MGVLQQVDKVDNKEVQLGFAALQVKERQVSRRRMEREEEEEEGGAFLMRDRTRSCSFLLCLDQDCNQSWPAKGFSSETFNSAQTDN